MVFELLTSHSVDILSASLAQTVPIAPTVSLSTRGDNVLAAPSGYVTVVLWPIPQTIPA